jgi:membrane associated rhomboid family serine protease
MDTDPRATQDVVPTCYRHPGRETYVSCTRCDRPICPDCMRDASVGHQCPECVNEGNRSVRQARTVFGGRLGGKPYATYTLIAINVVLYLIEITNSTFPNRFEMWGGVAGSSGGVVNGEWYRLVTGAFLHLTTPVHIIFNMWALWVVGPQLEQVLGRVRYVSLYLLAAVGGNVLLYLVSPTEAAVGASGAIFGLFGAFFVIGRRLGAPTNGIVTLIVINLVFTFVFPGIAWEGHVGGLITGSVLAFAFAYAPPKSRLMIQGGAVAAAVVVFAVAVLLQTEHLRAQFGLG